MRKSRIILMLVVGLALAGCARPDWIEQTLVTVDVTGTWVGSMGTGNVFREVRLEPATGIKGQWVSQTVRSRDGDPAVAGGAY